MNLFPRYMLAALALVPAGIWSTVTADGQPRSGKFLSMIEVVQRLEADGYGSFTELSLDDGNWEVELRKQGESLELIVDPVTGRVISEHRDDPEMAPPGNAMKLSKLLKAVAQDGTYQHFEEASFERRYWEIEVFRDGRKRELHVDPVTARIVAERADD